MHSGKERGFLMGGSAPKPGGGRKAWWGSHLDGWPGSRTGAAPQRGRSRKQKQNNQA